MRVLVLVDATNVCRSQEWRAAAPAATSDEQLLVRLVDHAAAWAALEDVDVLLVFDGVAPRGATDRCRVVGSGDRSADELLERAAGDARAAGRPHWVVSSDRAVRDVAGHAAERSFDAAQWVLESRTRLAAGRVELGGAHGSQGTGGASPLGAHADASTRERLERMRRGIE